MAMLIGRRAVIGGVLVALLPGAAPAADEVGAALDEAAGLPPGEGLARLARVDARGASTARRLDLAAARSGLAIDAELARIGWRKGMKGLPDGGDRGRAYDLLLQRRTGDGLTAAAARRRFEAEIARVSGRAARLFDRIGVRGETIGARYQALWRDERFLYPDSDAGRDRAVADMNRTLDAIRPRVTGWVGPVPAEGLAATARRMSRDEEAAGKQGYRVLPDGGHSGAYLPDLQRISARPSWTLPSVVAHELLPGHMVQLPIEALTPPHLLRTDYASSFVEGWAIHAETTVAASGLFAAPEVMLGHLHWLLFRLARGRADIGLHLDGWSADEAQARLAAWMGEPAYFAPFATDIARTLTDPGSRSGEAMAWLGIGDAIGGRGREATARILAGGRKRREIRLSTLQIPADTGRQERCDAWRRANDPCAFLSGGI